MYIAYYMNQISECNVDIMICIINIRVYYVLNERFALYMSASSLICNKWKLLAEPDEPPHSCQIYDAPRDLRGLLESPRRLCCLPPRGIVY